MKYINKFNESQDLPKNLEIGGLKCNNPNCDWSDMSIPFSDYEGSIDKECPKCGDNVFTQDDYDQVMQIVQAVELMSKYSEEDLEKIVNNLSEDEINSALDMMNQLKVKKTSDNEDGTQNWSFGESKINTLKHIKMFETYKSNCRNI